MATYIIWNRITKDQVLTEADSFNEACERLGFLPSDCSILSELKVTDRLPKKEVKKRGNDNAVQIPKTNGI
jgi:hypothetical protein